MPVRWCLPPLAGLLLTACSLLPSPGQPAAPVQRIAAPPGQYLSVAWLPSDWLVVHYEPVPRKWKYELYRLRPDGTAFAQLPLGEDPVCRLTRYAEPHALPDWRLGFQKLCLDDPRVQPLHGNDNSSHLMAYDLRTGEMETLLAEPIPAARPLASVTWNPTLTRGMFGKDSGLCSSIAWMTRTTISAPRITIQDGRWPRRRWRLERNLELERDRRGSPTCQPDGKVGWPAWSPGGQLIAFFASPQAIGVAGHARASVPFNLYLMDPEAQQPRKVLADIKYASGLAWSPDSQWLAFVGGLPRRGDHLWLFNPQTTTLHRVAKAELGNWYGVAWSPEGQQLVAVRERKESEERQSELVLFDVSALVAAP